ncbi:Pr6Pr family membrane protein [Actinospica sp.]|uniref:Pr6Pr family membrane protein n=1 Tax=Actinospica sp. TaxID=1872142 RepID=UPI002CA97182|nr:Pr6Pr family membrane protein [Actinospica sp.]HWG27410.1 Pr6Pr family membrane protein [Actinospica sp.]
MTKQMTAGALRVAFGLLGLVALAVGYDRDFHTGDGVNFFFYFTDLSNLFGAFVLLIGGVAALRRRPGVPDLVRGAAVLYLVITGLVYWTLLANTINAETIRWQNYIVHGVMPAVLLLDWLISPPKTRLGFGRAGSWLAFPILYLAVSLIRGPIVRWWPYDFLDPTQPGGYTHVTTWSFIVTGIFVVFMLLIVFVGNQLGSSSGSPSSDRSLSTRSA